MSLHGKNIRAFANGFNLSLWSNAVDIDRKVEASDASVFASGDWTESTDGLKSGGLKFDGYLTTGADGGLAQVEAFNDGAQIRACVCLQGDVVGSMSMIVRGVNTGAGIKIKNSDNAQLNIDVQPTGQFWLGEVLEAQLTRTADGNGADMVGTASTDGLVALLNVTGTAGTAPSTVFEIQGSADGTTWATIGSFAAATGKTAEVLEIAGSIPAHLRVTANLDTAGGNTTSVTSQVTIARL